MMVVDERSRRRVGPAKPHPAVEAVEGYWRLCRDCYDGRPECITGYLPRDPDAAYGEWDAILARTHYWHAFTRTIQGVVGLTFAEPPELEADEAVTEWAEEDVTGFAEPLTDLAIRAATELYITGRCYLWVDWAEARQAPCIMLVRAEDVPQWRSDQMGLSQVSVCQTVYEADPEDPWGMVCVPEVRVLMRRESVACVSYLWRDDKWVEAGVRMPTVRGMPLEDLPVHVLDITDNRGYDPGLPPLRGLAAANLAVYSTSAQIEKIAYAAGSPTPTLTRMAGVDGEDSTVRIGSTSVIALADGDSLDWVQADPGSITALRELAADKTAQMMALGARILETKATRPESGIALRVRTAAERGVMQQVAMALDRGITRALEQAAAWMGSPAPTWATSKAFGAAAQADVDEEQAAPPAEEAGPDAVPDRR